MQVEQELHLQLHHLLSLEQVVVAVDQELIVQEEQVLLVEQENQVHLPHLIKMLLLIHLVEVEVDTMVQTEVVDLEVQV